MNMFKLTTVKSILVGGWMLACFQIHPSIAENAENLTAKQLNVLAYEELKQGRYKKSFRVSKNALQQAIQNGNPVEEARALSNLGSNLSYLGENERALNLYLESLIIAEKEADVRGQLRAYNNIANVYNQMEEYDEGLKYRKLHLSKSILFPEDIELLISYIGLTSSYAYSGELLEAKDVNQKVKQMLKDKPDPFYQIYANYAENEIFVKQLQFDQALLNTEKALQIAKKYQYQGLIESALINIAEYQYELGNLEQAIKIAGEGLAFAAELGHRSKQLQAHIIMAQAYKQQQNFEKALYHVEVSKELEATIIGKKVQLLGEITKIERQVAETEQKLEDFRLQREILSLQLQKQEQNLVVWISAFSAFLVLFVFAYYLRNGRKEILRQRKLNEQLKELDSIKDRVLTNTSHELRTPLNGIIGLSDIILQDTTENISAEVLVSIKLIKESGEQLALVVNDILEMSKLKHDRVALFYSDFELAELIEDVITVCLPSTQDRNIRIINHSSVSRHKVKQDRKRLQQILFNIVGNAVKFTDKGVVEIECVTTDKEIMIRVSDTGIGIPKSKLDRVFEGFEQVESGNNRTRNGSGLGLAISRSLADALGGSLELQSEINIGTEVIITLPQVK